MFKKIIAALVCAMLVVSLAGCGNKTKAVNASDIQLFPVNINGMEIQTPPQKIISLSSALTTTLVSLDYGSTLIGVSNDYSTEEGASIESVGSPANPDIQKIIELKPDLVLTQQALTVSDTKMLSDAGIGLLVLNAPTNLYQVETVYKNIGKLFEGSIPSTYIGRIQQDTALKTGDKKANALLAASYASLFEFIQNLPEEEVSFAYVISVADQLIATGDTLEGTVLSVLGRNVAKDFAQYTVDFEQIKTANPDVLFVTTGNKESLMQNEQYKDLTAVQNGKVIEIDNNVFINQQFDAMVTLLDTAGKQLYN